MKFRHLLAAFAAIAVVGCTLTPATEEMATEEVAVEEVEADAGVKMIPGLYTAAADEAVIYYKRADNDYTDWGLHLWSGDIKEATSWYDAWPLAGISEAHGAFYIVPLKSADWKEFKFIVHRGNSKDLGGLDHSYSREKVGVDMFTYEGSTELFADPK